VPGPPPAACYNFAMLLLILLAAPPAVADADLPKLLAVVRPNPGEDVFEQIPWRTSLWQARKEAAAVGKPILLWEMDGNPLGCG
jgi:hypothetical protein